MTEVNHIGITVGDLDAAVTLYKSVFDLEVLAKPQAATLETPAGDRRRDVFGPRWGGMRIAHLATKGGRIGIELFEFIEPATVALRPILSIGGAAFLISASPSMT